MELKIYSKEGNLKLTASPDSNSAATCGIQEESVLALSFTAFECVTLEVYDYADFLGRRYWILERYQPKMNCDSEWSYSVQLSGVEGLTTQVLMVNPDDDDNPILTLTAPAREHAALIIANMNRKMGTTEWKVGEVVVSEYIDIEYTGKYASDALSELSSAAGTEWWFDGMTLNISRCEFGEPVPLSYGDGLIGGIERSMADGVKFFTRLFPVGSSRNIDPDRYGHARLQLPDGAKYVEQDTHLGIIEYFEQEAFDAIYPRRIGTVGSVRSEERTSDDGSPFTVWYFTDPDIPFDPNQYEIGGLVKRVTFQTGELRGREFEVNYDSEKKEFEIITQWPYDNDMQLPSEPLVPAPGNEYVLWNISMPDSYYPAAEQEFKTAVDTFMADSRKDISVFQASTDFTVVDKRNLDLKPGQRIRLGSDKFFPDTGYRDIRIVAISRSVVQPGSMTLKMSDVLSTGRISRIENQISEVTQITRQVSSEFPDIIKSWEETPASDTTLYSSRKSEREFLNKRRGGTVEGITRFLKRQQLDEGFRTSDFASGITGFGAQIDGRGAGELESLFIRRFLEVPELRYNRVGISVGDDWSAPGAGVIESVDKDQKLVTLKLEEGEIGAVAVGDICMGIFHDFDPSNNATADSDDGRGNFSFAGFATVYFRITEVLGDRNEQFRYELRPLSATFTKQIDPMESMTFVAYGSFTNPARQSSRYSTRTYQRYLRNVSDWEFTAENIAAQFGDLTNLSVFGIQMSGYSAYLDNIYLQGMISSLDKKALLDTRSKLFRLVGDDGVGVAFTPEAGWKQGKLYDPATGQFQKEFDIEQIDQTATEAQATANSADRKAQQAKDYIDNTLPGELSEINKRLDGVVENWFYPYTPSLYNEPAQTWIADGEQENHIGDTFTNTLPANFDPTDAGCWEQGSIGASYIDGIKTWDQIKIADSTRIRLKTPVGGIPKGAVLSVGEGYTMGYNPIASSGAVIASYVWSQSYTVGSDNPYMAFVIRKTDNAKITPAEYPQIHFTISSDETTNPDAGKSWRWVKEEDGTYKWTPIADSDAVKALQEAARAQDTADAKRRVFVVTPTTPYDVGDIWTQGEGGDIMRCIESRATGNFESSDWDKASKYTDDTAANEAKDEIANLQFGARNYIARQFLYAWNSAKEGVSDVVTTGADADGAYLYVNWGKLIQAGLVATNASQVSTVPDCFGGQIKYKPNTPYVFKARIKQGAEITFRIAYEDGTKEVLSAPPAGTEGVYEVVHTIDASRVVQKIYMYINKSVSMYLYDIQLTEGNKAPTGYITAEEDVQAQIEQAQEAIKTVEQITEDTKSDVSALKNFTDEAFTDGLISRAEATSIEKYTNSVEETQKSADASYTTVYNNPLLSGTAKSNLQAAKSAFDTAVADLLAAIRTASDDGMATPEEKAGVDSQYALFNDAYSAFCTRLEEANEYIQTAINTAAQGAYQLSQELQGVVNNINETILPDLQDQIDKSIISWGGEEVPTLDNYPANEWTTDTERKRHINDGYDRKITTDGEVSYESYKFVFENGVYQWNRIADSGSATAIAEARKALGLAGTKARVFYGSATPSVPYEVNDIWFRTSGSGSSLTTTLYISNADKGDGETASADDWQLVDDSQVRLRQMSSDLVISREEKAVLRNTLAQMQKEYAAYQSDADTYGISMTALSTAYNALVNFITGTVAVNNDTDTTLTQSQRTDYNARFAAYTSDVARFSNLIADAISQGKVDNIQIGGENMMNDSTLTHFPKYDQWHSNGTYVFEEYEGRECMTVTANKGYGIYWAGADFRAKTGVVSGDFLTVSADVFCDTAPTKINLGNENEFVNVPVEQAGRWIRLSHSYKYNNGAICIYYRGDAGKAGFRNVKIETGNKATAWSLSAADREAAMDSIAQGKVDGLQFGARNYIARQFLYAWNSAKEGVSDVVTTGADADGAYLYVNWGKLIQAGLVATNASQVSTVPDCFGGQIKYKPNTPYVFKARIKQGAEITFRIAYEDGTKEVLSAPPAGTEGVYEVVHTIDASRVVQKIYMYINKSVSMYLYDIQLTEGNKAPTGYITAEEDVQAQIEQVKLNVDYIASDSSLTPSDKQQVANEWARIQGEYWSIMANAEKYDVPTDSFTAYFQALEDYLTPLLADMSTTSEITGTEFRDVFSDYYRLSRNTSDLIDEAADEAIKSTEYLKQAMEDGSTEVKGGLIMTNVMLLKNADGEVTAGVSGLQEDDVPFWSGADYTNRKKAVFRVHADGEVHATKGTVGILQVKNDSVEVSDAAASGDKIILTPYRITSVSQVLGASSVPGVVETKEVSALATGQSNPFIRNVYESSPPFTCGQGVQMSARITGRITGNAEGGGGGVKIEVVNALTGKADPLYRNSTAEAQNTNLNIDATISHLFTGAAQKYYIRITVEASAAGKLTASATMNAAQFNFVKDIRKNLIAPNGVAVVKGSSNYAVFTGDIFEVLIGKAGLRIQNGYVYKRDTDHTTWTKI